MFDGRLSAKIAEQALKIVTLDGGREAWLIDGVLIEQVGFDARESPSGAGTS